MTTPKEPVCIPDPETQASISWGPGVHAQPPIIPGCCSPGPPCLLLGDPVPCTLGVYVLSLINRRLVSPPLLSVCPHLWGGNGGGGKIEPGELSPHPQTYPLPLLPLCQLPSGLLLSRNPSNFPSLPSTPSLPPNPAAHPRDPRVDPSPRSPRLPKAHPA